MNPTLLQKQLRDNNADLLDFCKDMESWSEEMKRKEAKLKSEDDPHAPLPRNIKRKSAEKPKQKKETAPNVEADVKKNKTPKDFSFWERFDADAECEKIDKAHSAEPSTESDTEDAIEEANEFKEQGNEFVRKGQWMEAKDSYTSAIDRYNRDATYYCNRALCYLNIRDYRSAETDCTTALQLDKKYVKAMFRRAKARMELQQNEAAIADLNTLLVIEPENKDAQKLLDSLVNNKEVKHVSKFTASRGKQTVCVNTSTGTSNEPAFTGKVIERKAGPPTSGSLDVAWPAGDDVIIEKSVTKLPKDRSLIPLKRIRVTNRL